MTTFIQSCAGLFNDIFAAMWSVEYFRLPISLMLFLAAVAVLLMLALGVRRL